MVDDQPRLPIPVARTLRRAPSRPEPTLRARHTNARQTRLKLVVRRPFTLDSLSTARLFRAVRPRIPNLLTRPNKALSSPAPKDQLVEPLERTALQVLGDGTSMTCHLPVPVRPDSSRAPSPPEGESGARSSSCRLERRTVSDPVPIDSPRKMRQPSPGRPRPCLWHP